MPTGLSARRYLTRLAVLCLLFIAPVAADDWGSMAVISSTMGTNAGRICTGEGTRAGDIGCATYAPFVAPTGNVGIGTGAPNAQLDVIGLVSASNLYVTGTAGTISGTYGYFRYISGTNIFGTFVGDGSGLTGVTADGSDKIVSGTTTVVANGGTGYVSFTSAGTTTGYYSPGGIFAAVGISTSTNQASFTTVYSSGGINVDTSSSIEAITIRNRNAVGYASINFNNPGGTQAGFFGYANPSTPWGDANTVQMGGGAGVPLTLWADNTEVVRVANGGLVGINTATPTAVLELVSPNLSPSFVVGRGYGTKYGISVGGSPFGMSLGPINSNGLTTTSAFSIISNSVTAYGFNIGGNQPSTTVHLNGALRISQDSSSTMNTCDANRAGAIKWNGSAFQVCYGSGGWALLSSAAVSGTVGTPDWYSVTNIPTQVGAVSNSGNISLTNLTMTGTVSGATLISTAAAGTVSGSYLYGQYVSASTGNITSLGAGNIAASGYVSAATVTGTYHYGTYASFTDVAATNISATNISASGNISANKFFGDGSALTGVTADSSDRIVSGTTAVYANSNTGFISFTSAGTTTGHYSPGGILSAVGISTSTNQASFTTVYASGNVGIGTSAPRASLDVIGESIFTSRTIISNTIDNGIFLEARERRGANLFQLRESGDAGIMTLGYYGLSAQRLQFDGGSNNVAASLSAVDAGGVTAFNFSGISTTVSPDARSWIGSRLGLGQSKQFPQTTLDISGSIRIGLETSTTLNTCDTNRAGAIRWDGTQFQVCYGSGGWALLSSAATSGTTSNADRITSGTTVVYANGDTGYVSFTSNGTTTGYYSPAGILAAVGISTSTNQASFTTVYASGKVGIMAAPNASYDLYVNGTSFFGNDIRISNNQLLSWGDGSTSVNGRGGATGKLDFTVNSIAAGTFDSSGRLLLGATAVTASRTLHVSGTALTTSWTGINFASAANVTPTAPLEVSGTVSATAFVGDGSGLTNLSVSGDRITSGTAQVIARNNANISVTTNVDVSGTLKLAGTAGDVCNAANHGTIRRNPATGALQVCH